MGIFTRTRDIISANVNTLLEKAEDPEKLVRHLIGEMEDTLVALKASCASTLAAKKRIRRDINACDGRVTFWEDRALRAVDRKRDQLARDALREKRLYSDRCEWLEKELDHCDTLVTQYREDINELEEKLTTVREKQRILVHRHTRAVQHKRAQTTLRRFDTSATMERLERMQNRIDRMDAEGELVNYGSGIPSLAARFSEIEKDDEIEEELEALKASAKANRPAAVNV